MGLFFMSTEGEDMLLRFGFGEAYSVSVLSKPELSPAEECSEV